MSRGVDIVCLKLYEACVVELCGPCVEERGSHTSCAMYRCGMTGGMTGVLPCRVDGRHIEILVSKLEKGLLSCSDTCNSHHRHQGWDWVGHTRKTTLR